MYMYIYIYHPQKCVYLIRNLENHGYSLVNVYLQKDPSFLIGNFTLVWRCSIAMFKYQRPLMLKFLTVITAVVI